jgi:hypothetical protein
MLNMLLAISLLISINVFFLFDPCPGYDSCSEFADGVKAGEADPRDVSDLVQYMVTVDSETRYFLLDAKVKALGEIAKPKQPKQPENNK